MDYELAKELKDAGFSQTGDGAFHNRTMTAAEVGEKERCYFPTLEELIEACGQPFWLETAPNWVAGRGKGMNEPCSGPCSNPTEAVARLWLALNQKKNISEAVEYVDNTFGRAIERLSDK